MFTLSEATDSCSSSADTKLQQEDAYSSLSSGGTASPPPQSDEEVTCYSLATHRPKNPAGRRVFKETRHPVFRGVRRRNGDKWVCEMREPNNKNARIWLGTYPTPEMAARAHDVAALAFRGKSACLNFADSAWRLPVPASLDAKVIRKVANAAAQMFRHRLPEVLVSASGCTIFNSTAIDSSDEIYMDEEEMLHMPRLLADMAEGLLLSPPSYLEDNWDHGGGEIATGADQFLLWNY